MCRVYNMRMLQISENEHNQELAIVLSTIAKTQVCIIPTI